jgi:mitotic spindle assembly checkpoint protein MAD2
MHGARAHAEVVSLRGASELTSSYLKFAINSILYNRQVFPRQSFASAQRFGCEVRVTRDEWLEKYLTKFFGQVLICDGRFMTCMFFL